MKIAVEISGWDAPLSLLARGLMRAASDRGLEFLLFGPKEELEAEPLLEHSSVEIVDAARATDGSGPDDGRESASALPQAAEAVLLGRAAALVSTAAPSRAAAAAAARLKRLPGVLKPALAARVPTARGPVLLLDAGSTVDCKPWHLLQFALMGSAYAELAMKIPSPRVALLSAAADAGEPAASKEILPLMKHAGIRFAGPASAEELVSGSADVFVCDGALGDAASRLHRGLSSAAFEMLESGLQSSPFRKVGGALISGALKGAKSAFLGAASGGAPLLGLGGPVAACLGPRTAETAFDALGCAADLAASDVGEAIRIRLAGMEPAAARDLGRT